MRYPFQTSKENGKSRKYEYQEEEKSHVVEPRTYTGKGIRISKIETTKSRWLGGKDHVQTYV
jgi:hypothetical protein